MRPYFLHVDVDKVRKTFQRTTQFATNVMSGHRIIPSITIPLPTTSGVATNLLLPTLSSPKLLLLHQWPNDGPDFVGRTSLVIDIYGMSSEKQFVNTLEDVIRKGAMDKLVPTALASKFQTSRRNSTCPMHRRLAERTNYQHQTLQNIVGKSSKGTYNGT
jgi:hypothetical protein